ncbi:hypothetical protein DVR12_22770 [Chitinophaga silvatica]|uniref:Uncharacterized protein n=2 Tax=Chitinophaga silvatica TaxID=2282649 RepID=A0A3E1Y421_9BACT|nr:hypothetical protein DVR12_22770 [Chitinophaga silvatica]
MGTSTGATFHIHYCMGKLVDVKLGHNDAKKCSKCGDMQSTICAKKCCKDEYKTVKLTKDQKVAVNTVQAMQQVATATTVSFVDLPLIYSISMVEEYPVSNAPPRSGKVPSYILNCIYRI